MRLYLRMSDLMIIFIYFLCFVKIQYISSYNVLIYFLLVAAGLYTIAHFSVFLDKRFFNVNILLTLFCLVTLYTSFINRGSIVSRDSFLSSIIFVGSIFEVAIVLEYISSIGEQDRIIDIFTFFNIGLLVVNDFLVYFQGSIDGVYLVGSKFGVVYFHWISMALIYLKYKDSKRLIYIIEIILTILTAMIAIKVNCMTGLLGLAIIIICFIFKDGLKYVLISPKAFLLTTFLSTAFVWGYEMVISNPYVANFITNTLNRTLTLTGRTYIYDNFATAMSNRWLLGWGYGTSYEVCVRYFGYADSQNAILEWILQTGIIGALFLIATLTMTFSTLKKFGDYKSFEETYPLITVLYAFTILGAIEITYSVRVILLFVLLLVFIPNNVESEDDRERRGGVYYEEEET